MSLRSSPWSPPAWSSAQSFRLPVHLLRGAGPSSCSSSVFAPFPSASSTSLTCPACWADPGLAAAGQDVLGLRHHSGLFRGRRRHPHRHHGAACRAPPHRGDRDLRIAGLDSESLRRAKQSLQLGRQCDLHRFGRRQLGRLRLHQRSGKNQTNPAESPEEVTIPACYSPAAISSSHAKA